MGCCFSFQPSAYEVNDVPNWDGRIRLTGTANAVIHVTGNVFQGAKTTDMTNVNACLGSAAGQGMRCVATYAPVMFVGKQAGVPFHMDMTGLTSANVTSLMIYQVVDEGQSGMPPVLETVVETVEITYQAGLFQVSASGFQNMYAKLAELGANGYSLSTVFDIPNLRRSGIFSAKTQVQIIAQRVAGTALTQSTYDVTSVPIKIFAAFGGCTADTRQLMQALQQQMASGKKLASIFNPSSIQMTGFGSATTNCHLIFTPVAEPYNWCAVDINLRADKTNFTGGAINYQPLSHCLTQFANKGWELGGIIPVPQIQQAGFCSFQITARLIFQSRADGVSTAGSIPQVIASAVTIAAGPTSGIEMGTAADHGSDGAAAKLIARA
jgi:hypothetical protein